jgi:hypothetical protein
MKKVKIMHSLALSQEEEDMVTYLKAKGFNVKGIFREGLTHLYKVLKEGERPCTS